MKKFSVFIKLTVKKKKEKFLEILTLIKSYFFLLDFAFFFFAFANEFTPFFYLF
jgi:hypothetical protein